MIEGGDSAFCLTKKTNTAKHTQAGRLPKTIFKRIRKDDSLNGKCINLRRSWQWKNSQHTLVRAGKRGRNLLLNSDNSHVVLGNFERPNLDVQIIRNYLKKDGSEDYFAKQFMGAVQSGKYDTIIIDNLTDLIDLALQDYKRTPGTPKDERQHYKMIYDDLKYLARQAGQVDCNVIFTCWLDTSEMTMPDGTRQNVFRPQLPDKILNNICGLCNIVGRFTKP